ncbi:flippase [Haladaptatus pallidirubidus]|uniref:Lipopolysaccharide biosynthesis protein n=2 Tax=Haladaptatus pallidirubidus TaxID=1008152 RepID=A0AAV3UQM9_9EURY|nr:flippase [Haladaptatus pallidirubidus]
MEVDDQNATTETEQSESHGRSSSLASVSRGAGLFLVGKGTDNALRLGLNIVLTRGLGEGLFGVYSYGYVILSIVRTVTNLGTDTSILKFLPQYSEQKPKQNQMLGLALLTSLVGSLLISGFIFFGAPFITRLTLKNPLLTDVLRILALVLPFTTLSNILQTVFKALELPEYQVLLMNVVTPTVRLLLIAVPIFLGYKLLSVVAASVAASIVVFVATVSLFASRTAFRPTLRGSRGDVVEFYNYSLPLTLTQAGAILANRIDLLMVGIFISEGSTVGIYKAALVVAGMLVLPLSAFNQIFPPVASRLYTNGKTAELQSLYQQLTRWIFTVALFFALGAIVYSKEILFIFGEGYTDGSSILVLFALGQLANAAVGPSGFLLMMTDHQYLSLVNRWGLGILNVICNYVFIQEFGVIGAALATASVLALINFARVAEVWYTEGLFPYSRRFVKPIVAGIATGLIMYGFRSLFSGYPLLVVGGGVGFCVFSALLLAAGIEEEDHEFFSMCVSYVRDASVTHD